MEFRLSVEVSGKFFCGGVVVVDVVMMVVVVVIRWGRRSGRPHFTEIRRNCENRGKVASHALVTHDVIGGQTRYVRHAEGDTTPAPATHLRAPEWYA